MGDSIIKIDSKIRDYFDVKDVDIRTYSPLTLAYIGDGIYDLVIRSIIVGRGNTKASKLHMRTSQIVKANAQAHRGSVHLPRHLLSFPHLSQVL